jgi:WD40 repeat protein
MTGTARLWNIPLHTELPLFNFNGLPVAGIAFSADGKKLAVADGFEGDIQIRGAVDNQTLRHSSKANINFGVRFSPDGLYLLSGDYSGIARLWDLASGKVVREFVHPAGMDIYDVAFSPDGKKILTGGPDLDRKIPVVQVWNAQTGDLIFSLNLPAHDDPIFRVAFSPDGRTMLTAHGVPPMVKLWDANTGDLLIELKDHTGWVTSAEFSPDGKNVVSSSLDKTARLWDVKTGQEIRQFIGHTDGVWKVAFSPDGKTIATASADGTARLWDVQTGRELRRFVGHTAALENVIFSPDSKFIVTAGDDGMVRYWDVDYHTTIQYLCSHLLRDFTDEEQAQYNITDKEPTCPKP